MVNPLSPRSATIVVVFGNGTPAQAAVTGRRITPIPGSPGTGDGTRSGALTWARDQLNGGTGEGLNMNNGAKTKDDISAWNNWCLAFVATAYGRRLNELKEMSAITSYENFNRAGKIKTDKTLYHAEDAEILRIIQTLDNACSCVWISI